MQFEYKFLSLTPGKTQHDKKTLNDLAADGWGVVAPATQEWGANANVSSDARLVLKRAKR